MKTSGSILTCILLTSWMFVQAQVQPQNVEVKRTQEKTIIDGRIYYIHTVQKGQTIYSISKAYGVTQEEILRQNPGMDPHILKDGQAIRIPVNAGVAPVYPSNREDFTEVKVKKGQTVYSLARKYDVEEELVYKYNPWAREGIQHGQTLWIPRNKNVPDKESGEGFLYHTVKEQETLYSLSQVYHVAVADIVDNNEFLRQGLKAGQVLKIPEKSAIAELKPEIIDSLPKNIPCTPSADEQAIYNVALILPFFAQYSNEEIISPSDTVAEEGTYVPPQRQQGLRGKSFAEFYEGFLLALDSMKSTGFSVNLSVYDSEHDSMRTKKIVRDLTLDVPDLIIGPVYSEDVKIAGRMALYNDISVVSPLSTRQGLLKNPRVIQVIPSRDAEYRCLANYMTRFSGSRFFMIRGTDSISMRNSWIFKQYIRENLSATNIPYEFHDYLLNDSLLNHLSKILVPQQQNIVIVFSESEPDVSRLVSKLFLMSQLYPMELFGMPIWQSWKTIELNYFHQLNLHLISPFYADANEPAVRQFFQKCRSKYGYEPFETSVQGYNFCMLGYDMGYYFLSALKLYGKDFQQCLPGMDMPLLLSPYHFVQQGQGGYLNEGFNMVQYNPDFTITNEKLRRDGFPEETGFKPVSTVRFR